MSKPQLTTRQLVARILFLLVSVLVISWAFPHNEGFRYEYEVGKPWRYGRLSAPYDFPIYRSDSAVMQIEDSLRRRIVPRYTFDAAVPADAQRQLASFGTRLSAEASEALGVTLGQLYSQGIVTGEERDRLQRYRHSEVILVDGDTVSTVPAERLLSELQAYDVVRGDTVHGKAFALLPLQRLVRSNLVPDTAAMNLEYARLRQQVSTTSGIILAESRIIDNGEIVTPQTYDVLESYRREQLKRQSLTSDEAWGHLGRIVLAAFLLLSIEVFLYLFRNWIFFDTRKVNVAIGSITLAVVLTSLALHFAVGAVYLVPIGIVTILLSTFHGSRTAFFGHIVMVLLCSFIAPSHFEYLFIQTVVGIVIIFSLKDGLQDRRQLMHVSIFSLLAYIGSYLLYTLANEASLASISLPIVTMMVLNAILLLTSYLIIYALENAFGFMSGVTLVELCNMGKGLLLRLSQEAPGTFQHSIQVANLSAAAAKEVGASIALVRTGAMYHDVGKLVRPQMFTENQQGSFNPMNELSIEESVDTIKHHVSDGIRLAEKERLPQDIIDFIVTHHGRTQVRYFYIKWCNEHPDQEPDADFFAYPGPDPATKEQAIVMLADKIEATSRSLQDYSRASIRDMVSRIVDDVVAEGRLNGANITLREIQQCKEAFIAQLVTINHGRIAYPTLNKS